MVHLKFEALVLQWTFEEVLSDKFQIDLGGVVDDTRDVITSYQVEEGPDKTQATMPPALEVGDEELGMSWFTSSGFAPDHFSRSWFPWNCRSKGFVTGPCCRRQTRPPASCHLGRQRNPYPPGL